MSFTTAALAVAFVAFSRPPPVAVSRPLPETLTRRVATGPRVTTLASLTTARFGLERPWKKALPEGATGGGCGDAPRQASRPSQGGTATTGLNGYPAPSRVM